MSEDVDFKIVPQPSAPVSRNGLRRERGKLGDKVTQAQQDAGFELDPTDKADPRPRNENRYTLWQLPYDSVDTAELGLRPTIQIELTYSLLRLAIQFSGQKRMVTPCRHPYIAMPSRLPT